MKKVKELNPFKIDGPVTIDVGPFVFSIEANSHPIWNEFISLYSDFNISSPNSFVDFPVSIEHSDSLLRRVFRRQSNFKMDNFAPFIPMPFYHAYPMLEWGMNWSISSYAHSYLIIHAAVITKNDRTIILPAPPGSGKSTLTALLVYSGWRLLSDELALINVNTKRIHGLARPINLKNGSIDVIKSEFPNVIHSTIVKDTHKGTVCLFKAPAESVKNMNQTVSATHVLFPKYDSNKNFELRDIEKHEALFSLIENSFNYNVLGEVGFDVLTDVITNIRGFKLSYSDNSEAIMFAEALANGAYD